MVVDVKLFFKNLEKFQTRPHFITVSYERLVSSPNKVQYEIASFFDLKISKTFKQYWQYIMKTNGNILPSRMHKGLHKIRPINSKSIGNWKKTEHRERMIDQLNKYSNLSDLLIRWGYEKDKEWIKVFKK